MILTRHKAAHGLCGPRLVSCGLSQRVAHRVRNLQWFEYQAAGGIQSSYRHHPQGLAHKERNREYLWKFYSRWSHGPHLPRLWLMCNLCIIAHLGHLTDFSVSEGKQTKTHPKGNRSWTTPLHRVLKSHSEKVVLVKHHYFYTELLKQQSGSPWICSPKWSHTSYFLSIKLSFNDVHFKMVWHPKEQSSIPLSSDSQKPHLLHIQLVLNSAVKSPGLCGVLGQ